MHFRSGIMHFSLFLLSMAQIVVGRERWLNPHNKTFYSRINPRSFGHERPFVLITLQSLCQGDVCGTLAGKAINQLLAAAPECSQQDVADEIIDASFQFDEQTRNAMVQVAIEYRQAEKNTPPDFTTFPLTLRNSVYCQRPPRNQQLRGLVQAQDPANDPNLFFEPTTGTTVFRGSQPNTFPLLF